MNLISPLISGMVGATSGTVRIYRRGTSTRATLYSDFEGASSLANTSDLTLDANGRREIYVNEPVDVTVISSAGVSLITFTMGQSSPNVEYQGIGFSGVDYENAASGIGSGYPTTVQAIFDLWKTNSGAADWKVLYGGVATTLQSALKLGIFFNVKDTVYGALGDGSTDDTAAIQATIAAAVTAGGGTVWFPAGTYKCSTGLTLPQGVNLLGAGSNASIINNDHATQNLLSMGLTISSSLVFAPSRIEGLKLAHSASGSGNLMTVSAGFRAAIVDCLFGEGAFVQPSGSDMVSVSPSTSTSLYFERCTFSGLGDTARAFANSSSKRIRFHDCLFVTPATCNSTGIVTVHSGNLDGCIFDCSASTSGTFSCFKSATTTLDERITNCKFINGGGATVTAMTLGVYTATSVFFEANNNFGSSVTAYSYTAAFASLGAEVILKTRETRRKLYTTSVSIPIATDQYGMIRVSSDSAVTLTPVMVPHGATGSVLCTVTGGVNKIISLDVPFLASGWLASIHTATPTMIDGFTTPVTYRCNEMGASLAMNIQVGGT